MVPTIVVLYLCAALPCGAFAGSAGRLVRYPHAVVRPEGNSQVCCSITSALAPCPDSAVACPTLFGAHLIRLWFQVNEFVKRVRAARTHCILVGHLRKQLPAMFGARQRPRALPSALPLTAPLHSSLCALCGCSCCAAERLLRLTGWAGCGGSDRPRGEGQEAARALARGV